MSDQEQVVQITKTSRFYDEMISDVMTFVTFSTLFFLADTGILPADAGFTIGVVQLSLVGLFFVGARERVKYNPFWGNMNFIFVFFFGVLGGANNVLGGLGFEMNPVVMAIPNLLCGAAMLCTIPGVRNDPWTSFLLYVFAAVAVFSLGLAGIGVLSSVLTVLAGVCLGGVAVLGLWSMIAALLGFSGITVPVGKPWFKK